MNSSRHLADVLWGKHPLRLRWEMLSGGVFLQAVEIMQTGVFLQHLCAQENESVCNSTRRF
jgi:hypothetical protein